MDGKIKHSRTVNNIITFALEGGWGGDEGDSYVQFRSVSNMFTVRCSLQDTVGLQSSLHLQSLDYPTILVLLVDNAHAYCIALCLFDIFFITDRQRFIKKRIKENPGHPAIELER